MAVISEEAREIKDFPVVTNSQAFAEAIRTFPGYKHLILEDALQSAWIQAMLNLHVDELVVSGILSVDCLNRLGADRDDRIRGLCPNEWYE